MSATRDKNQQFAFVYSNLYQLYKKGKEAALAADTAAAHKGSGAVLKAGDLKAGDVKDAAAAQLRVSAYTPVEILKQRAKTAAMPIAPGRAPEPKPEPKLELPKIGPSPAHLTKATSEANHAIKSLKDNLKTLNDLHARLRFMLTELEDLVRE